MSTAFVLRLCDRRFFRFSFVVSLWIIGLIVGILTAHLTRNLNYLIFAEAVSLTPSVVGVILVFGVPFALCAVGIFTDFYPVCCAAVILESFSRGFCGFGVYLFCGTGAWLLRLLLMFSSLACSVMVLCVILRYCLYGKTRVLDDFGTITVLMLLCISVDHMLIAPFLMRLSMYI